MLLVLIERDARPVCRGEEQRLPAGARRGPPGAAPRYLRAACTRRLTPGVHSRGRCGTITVEFPTKAPLRTVCMRQGEGNVFMRFPIRIACRLADLRSFSNTRFTREAFYKRRFGLCPR